MNISASTLEYSKPILESDTEIIVEYWDERAKSYSSHVREELGGSYYCRWEETIRNSCLPLIDDALREERVPRALDIGCGPGFFSIVLAEIGFSVDAIDSSSEMLAQAQENLSRAGFSDKVNFTRSDALSLPFEDNTFNFVIMRNVTWLMPDLKAAYKEWRRVLAPGGKLLCFDANWYSYLVDDELNSRRQSDQKSKPGPKGWKDESKATESMCERCEKIALGLPSTYVNRPGYDKRLLASIGFAEIQVDEEVYSQLWSEEEQRFYATSPLFSIQASKI